VELPGEIAGKPLMFAAGIRGSTTAAALSPAGLGRTLAPPDFPGI